jgi:hypothetical protein
MAIAIVAPDSVEVGNIIVVTGSGFTAAGEVDLKVSSEEVAGGVSIVKGKLTAAAGLFDTTGVLDFCANEEGHVNITAVDVTAGTQISKRVQVFKS